MSEQPILRRSKRLQQKREREQQLQSEQNSITTHKKSKKRKRNNTINSNKNEPPKKRQKKSHPPPTVNVMHSKLFHNELDQMRYRKIFTSIQASELSLKYNAPSVIFKEISEFAIGSFRDCSNFNHCGNIIHILHQHNAEIDDTLHDEHMLCDTDQLHLEYLKKRAKFIIDKTKYFRYLSDYFCVKCIDGETNGLELCSVCNGLCIDNNIDCNCGHNLVYCKRCEVYCSYCNIPICHKEDETKFHEFQGCHQKFKCSNCGKKICSGDWCIGDGVTYTQCDQCWKRKRK